MITVLKNILNISSPQIKRIKFPINVYIFVVKSNIKIHFTSDLAFPIVVLSFNGSSIVGNTIIPVPVPLNFKSKDVTHLILYKKVNINST